MVLKRWRWLSDWVDRLSIIWCIALIVVMFGISITGIAHNFFAGSPLSWTYSLARLFVPWIALLSVTVAFKRGEHVAMTILTRRMPASLQAVANMVNIVLIAAFAVALLWYGLGYFLDADQLFMVSDRIQISHKWVAAAVPVGGLILLIHVVDGIALVGSRPVDENASRSSGINL